MARPGLSSIAGALAAELMAAVVAHPLGVAAPAAGTPCSRALLEAGMDLPLGEVPHMIRGSLGGFSQVRRGPAGVGQGCMWHSTM